MIDLEARLIDVTRERDYWQTQCHIAKQDAADARQAALEPVMREVETFERELFSDYGFNCANDQGHVSGMVEEFKDRIRALLDSALCTCTITRHERQENRACPVHFPRSRCEACKGTGADRGVSTDPCQSCGGIGLVKP